MSIIEIFWCKNCKIEIPDISDEKYYSKKSYGHLTEYCQKCDEELEFKEEWPPNAYEGGYV